MFQTQSIDTRYGEYNGTKTNSDYFWYYLKQLYGWREKEGLNENFIAFDHIVTQVDPGNRLEAVKELVLMQGYVLDYTFQNQDYTTSVLCFSEDSLAPKILIREPLTTKEKDIFWHINQTAPNRKGTWARYIGEVLEVKDIKALYNSLQLAGVHFINDGIQETKNQLFLETYPSAYTQNTIKYVQYKNNKTIHLDSDLIIEESESFLQELKEIKAFKEGAGVTQYMKPVDHIATRVMSQDRENAILEIVKLAPYYPWGAYNIEEQNSSTNPTRNIFKTPEKHFPAKVFTAGNNGFVVNFLEGIYNTTDIYAYNFGRSLHHIAFEIPDYGDGQYNIDKVVEFVTKHKPEMAGTLFGDRNEGLRQVFMKRSRLFGWATEYIQRFDGYHGFFTRQNVADLTGALMEDEKRV